MSTVSSQMVNKNRTCHTTHSHTDGLLGALKGKVKDYLYESPHEQRSNKYANN